MQARALFFDDQPLNVKVAKLMQFEVILSRLTKDVDKLMAIAAQHGIKLKELILSAANSVSQAEFMAAITTTRFQNLNVVQSMQNANNSSSTATSPRQSPNKGDGSRASGLFGSIGNSEDDMKQLKNQISQLENEIFNQNFKSAMEMKKMENEVKIRQKEIFEVKGYIRTLETKLEKFVEAIEAGGISTNVHFAPHPSSQPTNSQPPSQPMTPAAATTTTTMIMDMTPRGETKEGVLVFSDELEEVNRGITSQQQQQDELLGEKHKPSLLAIQIPHEGEEKKEETDFQVNRPHDSTIITTNDDQVKENVIPAIQPVARLAEEAEPHASIKIEGNHHSVAFSLPPVVEDSVPILPVINRQELSQYVFQQIYSMQAVQETSKIVSWDSVSSALTFFDQEAKAKEEERLRIEREEKQREGAVQTDESSFIFPLSRRASLRKKTSFLSDSFLNNFGPGSSGGGGGEGNVDNEVVMALEGIQRQQTPRTAEPPSWPESPTMSERKKRQSMRRSIRRQQSMDRKSMSAGTSGDPSDQQQTDQQPRQEEETKPMQREYDSEEVDLRRSPPIMLSAPPLIPAASPVISREASHLPLSSRPGSSTLRPFSNQTRPQDNNTLLTENKPVVPTPQQSSPPPPQKKQQEQSQQQQQQQVQDQPGHQHHHHHHYNQSQQKREDDTTQQVQSNNIALRSSPRSSFVQSPSRMFSDSLPTTAKSIAPSCSRGSINQPLLESEEVMPRAFLSKPILMQNQQTVEQESQQQQQQQQQQSQQSQSQPQQVQSPQPFPPLSSDLHIEPLYLDDLSEASSSLLSSPMPMIISTPYTTSSLASAGVHMVMEETKDDILDVMDRKLAKLCDHLNVRFQFVENQYVRNNSSLHQIFGKLGAINEYISKYSYPNFQLLIDQTNVLFDRVQELEVWDKATLTPLHNGIEKCQQELTEFRDHVDWMLRFKVHEAVQQAQVQAQTNLNAGTGAEGGEGPGSTNQRPTSAHQSPIVMNNEDIQERLKKYSASIFFSNHDDEKEVNIFQAEEMQRQLRHYAMLFEDLYSQHTGIVARMRKLEESLPYPYKRSPVPSHIVTTSAIIPKKSININNSVSPSDDLPAKTNNNNNSKAKKSKSPERVFSHVEDDDMKLLKEEVSILRQMVVSHLSSLSQTGRNGGSNTKKASGSIISHEGSSCLEEGSGIIAVHPFPPEELLPEIFDSSKMTTAFHSTHPPKKSVTIAASNQSSNKSLRLNDSLASLTFQPQQSQNLDTLSLGSGERVITKEPAPPTIPKPTSNPLLQASPRRALVSTADNESSQKRGSSSILTSSTASKEAKKLTFHFTPLPTEIQPPTTIENKDKERKSVWYQPVMGGNMINISTAQGIAVSHPAPPE